METSKPCLLCVLSIAFVTGCGQAETASPMTARELKVISDHDARVQAIDEQDTIRYFQQNPVSPKNQR